MENRKRVYISGKITGNEHAKIQFEEAYYILEKRGFNPMSPYHCGQCMYADMKHEEYMQVDFLLLAMAEYICILPNFLDSKGAKAEYEYAVRKNKGIIDAASGYRVILEPGWRGDLKEVLNETEI